MSPERLVTQAEALEAARTVWRLLADALQANPEGEGWVDAAFVDRRREHPSNYIEAGLRVLAERGHLEERTDTKRPQVRLSRQARPVQTSLLETTTED